MQEVRSCTGRPVIAWTHARAFRESGSPHLCLIHAGSNRQERQFWWERLFVLGCGSRCGRSSEVQLPLATAFGLAPSEQVSYIFCVALLRSKTLQCRLAGVRLNHVSRPALTCGISAREAVFPGRPRRRFSGERTRPGKSGGTTLDPLVCCMFGLTYLPLLRDSESSQRPANHPRNHAI